MGKVVLYIAMSLDGYIADEAGGVAWLAGDGSNPEALGSYTAFYKAVGSIILGWNTYNQIVTELSPDKWTYKDKLCYVVTHRQKQDTENIHFKDCDATELVMELKARESKNIWVCGGASIAQQFITKNLIDIYHITVIPTILGNGIRLFPSLEDSLQLIWVCGGASIAQQFITKNLIDIYHITVIPTILGNGIRLFPSLEDSLQLRLIDTISYNGIVDLVYECR